jgi:hypothetical protein
MASEIAKAASIFRTSPDMDDYDVYRKLSREGIQRQRAARLVEFLPLAYCRLILQKTGAQFSATFRRATPAGAISEHAFSSEPIWGAAVAFASEEVERGVPGKDLLAIAARSAEFDAANQLLNAGSKLQNVVFVSPVLPWPENGPE